MSTPALRRTNREWLEERRGMYPHLIMTIGVQYPRPEVVRNLHKDIDFCRVPFKPSFSVWAMRNEVERDVFESYFRQTLRLEVDRMTYDRLKELIP